MITCYQNTDDQAPLHQRAQTTSTTASEGSNHIHIETPGHFVDLDNVRILDRWFERGVKEAVHIKEINHLSTRTGAGTNSLESTRQLSGQRSKRSMPDTASYSTHSLMKDGVPSENSKVGINFVFGSKDKSKSNLNSATYRRENVIHSASWCKRCLLI